MGNRIVLLVPYEEEKEDYERKITGKILTPYRDEKGKFSSSPDKRKVYSEEFIVIGR